MWEFIFKPYISMSAGVTLLYCLAYLSILSATWIMLVTKSKPTILDLWLISGVSLAMVMLWVFILWTILENLAYILSWGLDRIF